jgi:asparagine synthetase B (glutamine-hydrolysing)
MTRGQSLGWQACLEPAILAMRHRDPDDQGVWHHDGIGLGHVRLSILDLSAQAISPCARLTVAG